MHIAGVLQGAVTTDRHIKTVPNRIASVANDRRVCLPSQQHRIWNKQCDGCCRLNRSTVVVPQCQMPSRHSPVCHFDFKTAIDWQLILHLSRINWRYLNVNFVEFVRLRRLRWFTSPKWWWFPNDSEHDQAKIASNAPKPDRLIRQRYSIHMPNTRSSILPFKLAGCWKLFVNSNAWCQKQFCLI